MTPAPRTYCIAPPGAWAEDAACKDTPASWWWPDGEPGRSPGLIVCAHCPVLRECRAHATRAARDGMAVVGIWGGRSFGLQPKADIFAAVSWRSPAQLLSGALKVRERIMEGAL